MGSREEDICVLKANRQAIDIKMGDKFEKEVHHFLQDWVTQEGEDEKQGGGVPVRLPGLTR